MIKHLTATLLAAVASQALAQPAPAPPPPVVQIRGLGSKKKPQDVQEVLQKPVQ